METYVEERNVTKVWSSRWLDNGKLLALGQSILTNTSHLLSFIYLIKSVNVTLRAHVKFHTGPTLGKFKPLQAQQEVGESRFGSRLRNSSPFGKASLENEFFHFT